MSEVETFFTIEIPYDGICNHKTRIPFPIKIIKSLKKYAQCVDMMKQWRALEPS